MKLDELLPIGSVVLLEKAEKALMIIGRLQRDSDSGLIYEYAGCLWPEGIISSDRFYLFNGQDIELLLQLGMISREEIEFRHELEKHICDLKAQEPENWSCIQP